MNQKGTVRLKFILLLFLACLIAPITSAAGVTEKIKKTSIDAESSEKEWVSNLVSKTSDTQNNGTHHFLDNLGDTPIAPEPVQKSSLARNEEGDKSIVECDHFDENLCKENGDCSITKRRCIGENHLRIVGCLAIFSVANITETNSTEPFLVVDRPRYKNLGCMQYQHIDSMSCIDSAVCRQGRTFRYGIGMCCCTKSNCNAADTIEMSNPFLKKDSDNSLLGSFFWASTPPNMDMGTLDPSPVYWIVTITLAVILFFAIFILAYIAWKYHQNKKEEKKIRNKFNNEKTDALEAGNTPLVNQEELIEMVETFKELPITDFLLISKGRFGKVFKAKWSENGENKFVAVKKLNETQKSSYDAEKRIFEELISFPKWYSSIVQFTCAEKIGNEYWIVTEFHERLSLFELLKHNVISITSANRIIMSMIDGLQFLHDDRPFFFGYSKKPIIHRDIKSKNILVKSDMTTCIADFGLARIYDFDIEQSDLLGQVGTKRYMSPEMLEGATEFTATAFKAMDVYSMGLVMWEVISRTKLTMSDVVPEYQMPFQSIGYDPSIGIMRNHVVSKKERPQFRPEVLVHDYMSLLARVTVEMWEPEACARITAGCAFARVWNHIMNSPDSSEGYHSGSSIIEKGEEEYSVSRNPEEIEEMQKYHASPFKRPHPSPNPFNDSCPPPPHPPHITEDGIIYQDNPTGKPSEPKSEEPPPDEPLVEKIFDVAVNRLFTKDEHEVYKAHEQEEVAEVNTRASTPTPSGTF